MRITVDPDNNIAYVALCEGVEQVESIKVSEDLVIDIGPQGRVCGIELLNAAEQLLGKEKLLELIDLKTDRHERVKIPG